MFKPIDDGGPAFPVGDQSLHPLLIGMSLRDWFAGQALGGLTAQVADTSENQDINPDMAARACYVMADAMLAERKVAK